MATIKDVARRAGVSISTVSKYLNGGNVRSAEAIREAVQALDFRVNPFARSLKTHRSRSIGILMPEMTAPFYGSVLTALDRTLRDAGYQTLIACYSSTHGLERDKLRFLISTGIDGLIYLPEDLSAEEFYELTAGTGIPVVQVDRLIQGVSGDAVLADNSEAVYKAVSLLIARGHRRIALVTGPKSIFSAKERQVGYLRALAGHGIPFDDDLVISDENSFATGYQSCARLCSLDEPPTAVLATNYNITMGLITAARERGLQIPGDLDICGFDCVEVCAMLRPPLPVVQQPESEIGRLAGQYLLQRLEGFDGQARVTRLPCRILSGEDEQSV